MYNPTCSHCKRKISSHCLRIQCDRCLHNFHCSCMMVTHEEYYNTTTWTCTTCRDDIFPFRSVTDIELQNLLLNFDYQYSLEYWCCDRIEFANKILNPFELNDIDCTQPNYEIDPDFHYYNDVNISNILKCNYYVSESFGILLKSRGAMNDFSVCSEPPISPHRRQSRRLNLYDSLCLRTVRTEVRIWYN